MYKIVFQQFPFDTTKNYDTTHYLNVTDIKNELSAIKSELQSVKAATGEIKFYKHRQKHKTFSMETINYNTFYISFENLANAIDIEEIINNIDGIQFEFMSYFKYPKNSVFKHHKSFTVYPNPADEVLNLDLPFFVKSLEITNINGETLKQFTRSELSMINSNGKYTVEIAGFPPGIYFMIINNRYFEKVVVKR